jgi:hypothetical protein
MKEVYHCTPSQLDEQSEQDLNLHFSILMLERKEKALKIKRQQQNG